MVYLRLTVALAACVGAGLLGCACAGCGRSPPPAQAGTAKGATQLTPRDVLTRLIAARESGEYHKMAWLVRPDCADDVVETLIALDDFLGANRDLCRCLRDHELLGLAQTVDQSYLGENVDIFSPYVELLDEQIEGDTAIVSFIVDGRLPTKRARLQRLDGVWRYDPGPGYTPNIPRAFHRMARGLRLVIEGIDSGRLPARALRDDPQRLVEEVRLRLLPGVKMLPGPPDVDQGPLTAPGALKGRGGRG